MVGPPGSGKSMLAERLSGLLPPLAHDDMLRVASIASVAGEPSAASPTQWPPFRAPHHTSSAAALVGGGGRPRPGEISLAHRGVLFLDELPEFGRDALEALREPLESGVARISRVHEQIAFPAEFQLVAAMNPCPCGYLRRRHRPLPVQPAAARALSQPDLGAAARPLRPAHRSAARGFADIAEPATPGESAAIRELVTARARATTRAQRAAQRAARRAGSLARRDSSGRRGARRY